MEPRTPRRIAWLVPAALGLAVLCGGLWWTATDMLSAGLRGKRVELTDNVAGIVRAELAYRSAWDSFVPAGPAPRASPDPVAVAWVGDPGFDTLGWVPDGAVRGVYRVEVSPDGRGFTVHGRCDVDGDGRYAEVVASSEDPTPRLVTPTRVH